MAPRSPSELDRHVEAVRRFNRFYSRQIGLLAEGFLHSPFSLTEVRVLYELAHRDGCTAAELRRELGLDAGYLSRILRRFAARRLVTRARSPSDGRQRRLALTIRGRAVFDPLEGRQRAEVAAMLRRLAVADQRRVVDAMRTIEDGIAPAPVRDVGFVLRPHQPGDIGWVVYRHGVLYAQEHGYDERFEALVARIAADFVEHLDARRERAWIAEKDGARVGCAFVVQASRSTAKLRLLLVEPAARGLGIGKRLVGECVRFAEQAGYAKMVLWTNSDLVAARHLYEQAGFRLVASEPEAMWGRADLVQETWELRVGREAAERRG